MSTLSRPSHFAELARGLGWLPWTRIVTLWAYFDESGWHPGGGKLAKLTVGGCIANFETWEGLSICRASAIEKMGIPYFHMTDFEARRNLYENWTNEERKNRLNILLDIIGAANPICCGFTNVARKGDTTETIYKRCAHDVLLELGLYEDEVVIVFAHHPEFAAYSPLHHMLMQWGYGKGIKSVTIGYPQEICPLQAADIVAYELRCHERDEMRPERYPLTRLHDLGCVFRSSSSVD